MSSVLTRNAALSGARALSWNSLALTVFLRSINVYRE
jgi:hypothetical protein